LIITSPHEEAQMPVRNQDEPGTGSRCEITGERLSKRELVTLDHLHPALADRIKNDFPALHADALISRKEADRYRILYVEELLKQERGELTEIDKQVARSLAEGEMVSQNVEEDYKGTRTLGERMADGLATFGGSWMFLITFGILLVIWMAINAVAGNQSAFDPYPFILLNLVLSCLAAIQAPIIMMSQKRQEAKDRLRSQNDYRVNLKAELEIRHLHEKLDHLISRQWQKLAEIQELQIELLQERR
jgi:uncharacterized membrane protein